MESLKFKVILGTHERREAFLKAIKKAGVNGSIIDADFLAGANFAWLDYKFRENSFFYNTTNHCDMFEDCDYPLIRLCEAIARLEKYAASLQPEFPFKPFDKIIAAYDGYSSTNWVPEFFSLLIRDNFWTMSRIHAPIMIAKYEGNENLLGESIMRKPPEWWEIKDGKPVLVKRGE